MTPATSPRPGGSPLARWAAGIAALRGAGAMRDPQPGGTWLARGAASLHLSALGILLATAWRAGAAGEGALGAFAAWHLAFLMATGAAAAVLTLSGTGRRHADSGVAAQSLGLAELMALMSHELRTPLNAVIGFSEVMLRELHGPLGHARYHEYAHHISESGGRLLKSSEQALAITEAVTALMGDRMRPAREKVSAAAIVGEAWRCVRLEAPQARVHLITAARTSCEPICERRATAKALEYLLREALIYAAEGSCVDITTAGRGGCCSLTIRARPTSPGQRQPGGIDGDATRGGLFVGLARLLLEAQGAALGCATAADGTWSAVVSFAASR